MTHTIYARLAAGLTIAAALAAAVDPAMAQDECGAPASRDSNLVVGRQQGAVTILAIGKNTAVRRSRAYDLEECRPISRDHTAIDSNGEACTRIVSGQITGDVQIGGHPTIRAKSGKAVTAIAIGSRSACNVNGTISSSEC
jgi:hypothetical protein